MNSQSSSKSSSSSIVNSQNDLNIKLVSQKYNLSCEAASLSMALGYYQIKVDEDTLLAQFGKAEPLTKQIVGDNVIWGDPNMGYVGEVDGKMFGQKDRQTSLLYGTGWGVNNGPVALVSKKYRPNSVELDNGKIEDIKNALIAKEPVIFWHQRDDAPKEILTITTPEGKKIDFFQNHVALIGGYRIEDNGSYIFKILDPYYGQYEIDETSFLRIWSRYQNNAVIVR